MARTRTEEVDVVVLGAGMAGLAAAVAIHHAEKKLCVLEARDRVGGRVHTAPRPHDASGTPVELGAEFVHGDAEALTRIARDAEIVMVEVAPSHWRRQSGALACDPKFEPTIGAALKKAGKRVRRGADTSFLEALDAARVRGGARAIALSYVEGFQAADPARISTKALAAGDLGSDRVRRVVSGYARIAEALAARLPRDAVRTSMRVVRVEWSRGAVHVETKSMSGREGVRIRARAAVVTLPLAILQGGEAEGVVFAPPLHRKADALRMLAAGDVVRVAMRFRSPFWTDPAIVRARAPTRTMTFLHAASEPFATFWTASPLDAPTITAWTGGPRAAEMAAHGHDTIVAHATASLARALGVDASVVDRELLAVAHHDWRADPFARGAYSYPLVGGSDAPRALRAPLSSTLFFAGEHTADAPDNGTVHGAIASGERAAREVVRALR